MRIITILFAIMILAGCEDGQHKHKSENFSSISHLIAEPLAHDDMKVRVMGTLGNTGAVTSVFMTDYHQRNIMLQDSIPLETKYFRNHKIEPWKCSGAIVAVSGTLKYIELIEVHNLELLDITELRLIDKQGREECMIP